MNAMTCRDVEEQLDLFAAGECEPLTRPQVERHLQHCAACAARSRESQRLLGLLDLHWNETGLRRLRQRIEQEERRPRRRQVVLPFARRAAALAALLLLSLGLAWFVRVWQPESESQLQLVASLTQDGQLERNAESAKDIVRMFPNDVALKQLQPKGQEAPTQQRFGEAFRQKLRQAQRAGKLPLPTAVPLKLVLKCTGPGPLKVRLGDPATELWLEVQGNGVVRIPAVGEAAPKFLQRQTLQLVPGKPQEIHIDHLIAGRPGQLEYIYLTEPGDYTLSARLRLTVGGTVAIVWSNRLHYKVGKDLP